VNIHLVDGTYELFRAFYGSRDAAAARTDGDLTSATRTLLRSLLALVRSPEVTHVAVAFDTVIESFRNQLFDGYKTGAGIEPALLAQFPLAEEATAALGVVVWGMHDFEADDAIAAAAARFAGDPRVERVYLCSPDKDLAQCVRGDRVVCLDRMRRKEMDEAGVVAKFGVSPASIPDFLALVGDTADGIPGVPRWGAKSAAALLSRYGHIDAIPDHEADWAVPVRGAAALAASLRAHRPESRLYRTLATLRTDVPLGETLDDLAWQGARKGMLEDLCARLGDSDFLPRVPRFRDDA
jgi:5'-3' exonuclease